MVKKRSLHKYLHLRVGSDIFSLGFGPFRWVCTSGKESDLQVTDQLAAEVIREQMKQVSSLHSFIVQSTCRVNAVLEPKV